MPPGLRDWAVPNPDVKPEMRGELRAVFLIVQDDGTKGAVLLRFHAEI